MSLSVRILSALRSGPATNAELQDACEAHGGEVARACNQLMRSGMVKRVDGGAGRGTIAIYARAA